MLAVRRDMTGRVVATVVGLFFGVAPALVFLVAGYVIASGRPGALSPGTVVAFTALQSRLFFPIGQLLQGSIEAHGAFALFDRVFEFLRVPVEPEGEHRRRNAAPSVSGGHLEFRSVYFAYDPAPKATESTTEPSWALADLSFSAGPGELIAVVGSSGAGKTTICYLAARLYDVTQGSVRLGGNDVRELGREAIASLVSMVTQETYLFHASVRHNLQYACPDASEAEIEAAARAALIHDRILQLDAGYDTLVGERGYRMSGGERQRIAIARVILRGAPILLLDEATSALDTASERVVQAALRPVMAGRTTIAIAHRLSTILAADTILLIDKGRIIERGSHVELLALNGQYARLYREQFAEGGVEAQCSDGVVLSSGAVLSARKPGEGS